MDLRIYADFNSGGSRAGDACWLLRYPGDPRMTNWDTPALRSVLRQEMGD